MERRFILMVLMTFMSAVGSVSAVVSDFESGGLCYRIISEEEKTCEVTGFTDIPKELSIPSSVVSGNVSYSVTQIGERALYNSQIRSVSIPNSVIFIGSHAFELTSISTVTIPESVEKIGEQAFRISRLTEFIVDSKSKHYYSVDGVLFDRKAETLVAYPARNARTSYTIPDGVKAIEYRAFYLNQNLTSVYIPGTVHVIGAQAFQSCSRLETVTFGNGVQEIGHGAFSGCSLLTVIDIPASICNIDVNAFGGCKLTSINVSQENTVYTSVDGVLFSKDMSVLCKYPQYKPDETYTIPSGVETIECSAFGGCSFLTSVVIPAGVKSIGDNAFEWCQELKKVSLPAGLESIGGSAFRVSGLKEILIPSSVKSIGRWAFANCSSLGIIDVEEDNAVYASVDGILFSKDMKELISCPSAREIGDYVIPSTVTVLHSMAFSGSALTGITIPGSIELIDVAAFQACLRLRKVNIQEGVVTIGPMAFSRCMELKEVTIPSSVTTFEDSSLEGTFYKCDALTDVVNLSAVPQKIPEHTFTFSGQPYTYGTLHVRPGCETLYRNADVWCNFNIVGDADVSGISRPEVSGTAETTVTAVYGMDGKRTTEATTRMKILKMNDGSVRKMIVK